MSYARLAIDSNVYIYTSKEALVCIVADDVATKKDLTDAMFSAKYTLEPGVAETLMLGHLIWLRDSVGILVPDRAINRLLKEITDSYKE